MGTLFTITLYAADETNARSAAQAAFRRVAELDTIMSDYDVTSELMRLREKPVGQPIPISRDLFDVLQRAQKFSELTDGALDVTVGPYVHLWRMARKKKVLPTPEEIAQARAAVGYRKIKLDERNRTITFLAPSMRLDLGGIGKGYAADEAMRILNSNGITRALVAASGDIRIGDPPSGKEGWRVGISPIGSRTNATIKTLLLHNAAISTSGDTEQFVEINGIRYSHIVDPKTGLGLTERIQVSVIAPDATTTDALDTAVSVLGAKRGLALIDSLPKTAAFVIVSESGRKSLLPSRRFKKVPEVMEEKLEGQSSR
jgi:thiamine biosynthesis lipoprotein